MADDQDQTELGEELEKKYDPERLLKLIGKRAGRGESLDHSIRAKYEKRFGVDLGHVRIVTGEFAEEFNRQRGAYAVTVGTSGMILMGNSPDRSMATASGQALLAHELTHVAQAKAGVHRSARGSMEFAEEHEVEAEAVEHEELHGSGSSGVAEMQATQHHKASMDDAVDKIKARVIELAGEGAQLYVMRNGDLPRRP
ncbi:MAG: DUF4157 domain-containing protein [Proteobacteria bacterium]|nr:DUF4157 domain-containing protein [Pseudomonadota bacterium]